MSNTIIFLSIIFLILSFLLVFKINIDFDLFNNKFNIKIKLFNLKIIFIKINLLSLNYSINNNNKTKQIKISLSKEEIFLFKQIKQNILEKLYYSDFDINTNIGLNNAYNTTILISILNNYLSYLSLKNCELVDSYINTPNFEKSDFKVYLDFKIYFTIFDLIFATIMSLYRRGKYVKAIRKK